MKIIQVHGIFEFLMKYPVVDTHLCQGSQDMNKQRPQLSWRKGGTFLAGLQEIKRTDIRDQNRGRLTRQTKRCQWLRGLHFLCTSPSPSIFHWLFRKPQKKKKNWGTATDLSMLSAPPARGVGHKAISQWLLARSTIRSNYFALSKVCVEEHFVQRLYNKRPWNVI